MIALSLIFESNIPIYIIHDNNIINNRLNHIKGKYSYTRTINNA
jgi:hypothetical protein